MGQVQRPDVFLLQRRDGKEHHRQDARCLHRHLLQHGREMLLRHDAGCPRGQSCRGL